MLWRLESFVPSAVCHLRICVRNSHFHWLRASRGTDLQTLQRLAGCRAARQLLLPGTFSLSAIAYDLAIARPLAVFSSRRCLEPADATGHAIPLRRLESSYKLLTGESPGQKRKIRSLATVSRLCLRPVP